MTRSELKYILFKVLERKLNNKYLVIESDDWGSFRIPSNQTYSKLEELGIQLNFPGADYYNQFDTLESRVDLESLFEILDSKKDTYGSSAIFTPLTLCANPDFTKIRNSNYSQFLYLNLKESLEYYQRSGAYEMYLKGIDNKLFIPQFHGREHLNVPVWMRALKNDIGDARVAFEHEVWGHINSHPNNIFYQAAFDVEIFSDIEEHIHIIDDGLKLFQHTFGYKAEYFVPPNGPMNNLLCEVLSKNGVKLIASDIVQSEPLGNGKFKRHFRFMGMKNNFGQKFIKRNCFFEPSAEGKDWVDSCLNDIQLAFKYNKPAIVSSHRVNYIGGLSIKNRDRGLKQLNLLLGQVLKNWPDVKFITTSELFDLI